MFVMTVLRETSRISVAYTLSGEKHRSCRITTLVSNQTKVLSAELDDSCTWQTLRLNGGQCGLSTNDRISIRSHDRPPAPESVIKTSLSALSFSGQRVLYKGPPPALGLVVSLLFPLLATFVYQRPVRMRYELLVALPVSIYGE